MFVWATVFLICWLRCFQVSAQSSSLNCPAYSLVNVSSDNIDDLVFGAFSPDTEPPDNSYNPGAAGPWYDIASGIINVVRPGSITEGVIVPLLESANVSFSDSDSFDGIDAQETGQDVAEWAAAIIALTILGGLLGIGLLFCCCCFGLCRCCGQCGGSLKQEETSSTNCCTIVLTVILVLFTCWLIAGVVLAFFSNQQVFDSVTEFEETVEETFDLAEDFLNDSVSQIETLLCEVEDTFDVTVVQADGLITQVNDVVNSYSGDIYGIVDQAISVSQDIEDIQGTLLSINATVDSLQANTSSINSSLQLIAVALADAFDNCTALQMNVPSLDCDPLDPSTYSNGLGANYFAVPNIAGELGNVQDIVGSVNLTESALEGNRTFNSAVQQITNLTTDVDRTVSDGLDELRTVTDSANDILRNFTNDAVGSDGYIDDARDIAEDYFDQVRQYDTPRYAVGVVISCSAFIVVILVLLGVCCGMCGFRTDRAPYERTDISNCGGITLIFAAFAAFLIGFFIMILSALVFFFGGVSTKFCDDLSHPDYTLLKETIDNPRFNGGKYFLSENLFDNGSVVLTVSGILVDCNDNSTVYQALKLDNLDFIQEIQNFTNISRLIPDVSLNVSSLTDSIADVFDSDSFVPSDLQSRLDSFTTAGVNTINVTQFRQQIDQNILSFNVTNEIARLASLRSDLNGQPLIGNAATQRDAIVASIDTTIDELMSIDTQVSSLDILVDALDMNVGQLNDNGQRLTDSASALLSNINTTFENLVDNGVTPLVDNASAVFPRAISYAQQLVDFGINALENEVGNCRPLFSVYSGFFNAYCSFTVDGLNGFWLALGMCGVLMIPIIILSVFTSQYYRRMKYDDDVGIPYESSFPMKTY